MIRDKLYSVVVPFTVLPMSPVVGLYKNAALEKRCEGDKMKIELCDNRRLDESMFVGLLVFWRARQKIINTVRTFSNVDSPSFENKIFIDFIFI